MGKIFIGLILTSFNFWVYFDGSKLGLIPDFLGYYLILKGLKEIEKESRCFHRIKPLVMIMMVYSSASYVLDIFRIRLESGYWFSNIIITSVIVFSTVIYYYITNGVEDIEIAKERKFNSFNLYLALNVNVLFAIVSYFVLGRNKVLTIISVIGCFAARTYYLYIFYKAKNLYLEIEKKDEEKELQENIEVQNETDINIEEESI